MGGGCLNRTRAKTRTIALVILACFWVAFMLSSALILTHADHAHDHDGVNGSCLVCAQIQNAESLLKQIGTALACLLLAVAGLFAVVGAFQAWFFCAQCSTPVALKIRLNQ